MPRKSANQKPVETSSADTSADTLKPYLPPFKEGQEVFVSLIGLGLTSYELYKVAAIMEDGKVELYDLDYPFDGKTGQYLPPKGLKLDFKNSLCITPEQVTAALAYVAKYSN